MRVKNDFSNHYDRSLSSPSIGVARNWRVSGGALKITSKV